MSLRYVTSYFFDFLLTLILDVVVISASCFEVDVVNFCEV